MLLGTQLFVAGFLGDLITRHRTDRNHYEIGEEITDDAPALNAPNHADELKAAVPAEKVRIEAE